MALTAVDIQKAYIAFFNRPADVPGMTYWLSYPGDAQDLLNEFAQSAEYLSDYAGMTNMQMVTKVYNNLFGRNPEPAGLTYWVAQMDAGYVTLANVAYEIMGGAQNEDAMIIDNKAIAAQAFTDALVTPEQIAAYNNAGPNGMGGEAKAWLAAVDESTESVAAANAELGNLLQSLVDADSGVGPTPDNAEVLWLTSGGPLPGTSGWDPTIYGSADKNTTFIAQTGQLGENAILDGRAGNNELQATIRGNEAIAPTTKNIQKVVIRGQDAPNTAWNDNNIMDGATVDADRMVGVKWWENKNSRVDVVIEDVRILDSQITKDITIAFRESDPGHVDYAVYFDQPSLRNQTSTSGVLVAALFDSMGDATDGQPLKDNPYTKIMFAVDGMIHEVDFGVVNGASTFQDLRDAIQAAINANPALAGYGITVTLNENVTFWVPSDTAAARANAGYFLSIESVGHTIGEGGWATSTGFLPPNISTQGRQDASNPVTSSLVTSTVILDYVGRGSMGGDLMIGGMSVGYTSESKGVQQFDITVERDSKLEVIQSTNNTLQVVNLVNSGSYNYLGAYERGSNQGARSGDLTVTGDTNVNTIFGVKKTSQAGAGGDPTDGWPGPNLLGQQYIDGGGLQQWNGYGFTDVRVINGAAFKGNLELNAVLTSNVVGKYMNLVDQAPAPAAADNVVFNYTLGAGNDTLDIALSAANLAAAGTTTREDFVLNIDGGAGNDTITTAIYADNIVTGPLLTTLANAAGGAAAWYQNHQLNANLFIDGGSGNDTIQTMGSGDWTVKLGTGNDTYYADNTAATAVWVFNTADQLTVGGAVTARGINNLQSAGNNNYIFVDDGTWPGGAANDGYSSVAGEMAGLYGLKLRVVYNDVSNSSNITPVNAQGTYFSSVVDVPTTAAGSFTVTDLQINQAIKKAINDDPVLNKLLVAKDGPSNTLVVTALSDGTHLSMADLGIEFAIPTLVATTEVAGWNSALHTTANWTAADLQNARIESFNALLGAGPGTAFNAALVSAYDTFGPNPGTPGSFSAWYSANPAANTGYLSAFANQGGAVLAGANSGHVSSNVVIVDGAASDIDVVVLSTGTACSDTIKWDGSFNNGTVTVVNFDTWWTTTVANNLGDDFLDFTAYGARALYVAQLDATGHVDTAAWSVSQDTLGLGSVDAGVAGVVLPTTLVAAPNYVGDWTLKAGDKYITMTRVAPNATDADNSTVYKIELWTANGTAADAYLTTLAVGDVRDTAQLIGYVDLGRVIEGVVDTDSILSHIDIF